MPDVFIPNGVNIIDGYAFNCRGISNLSIPNSVEQIGVGAFVDCTMPIEINAAESNQNYLSYNGVLFNKYRRNNIRNQSGLEDLMNILSFSIGSLTNPEKIKNTFRTVKKSKIISNTIKKYLTYFEDSFIIESAHRYDIKGKSYIETPKKYYFSDLGLRNARINFRQFEQTHSMENVIYIELRMTSFNCVFKLDRRQPACVFTAILAIRCKLLGVTECCIICLY